MADPDAERPQIPQALLGFAFANLLTALCVGPMLHEHMSELDRLACAVAGFVAVDIGAMMAQEFEEAFRLEKGFLELIDNTCMLAQSVILILILSSAC